MNITNSISKNFNEAIKASFVALLSVITSVFILKILNKEIRFSIGVIAIIAFGCFAAIIRDKKSFLIVSLLLFCPIGLSVFLWRPTGLHYSGPQSSLELYLFDLPLFIFLFLLLVVYKFPNKQWKGVYRTDIGIYLLLVFCLISFIPSKDRMLSFTGMLLILRMAIIYFCISRGVTNQKNLKVIIISLMAGLIAECLLGMFQVHFGFFKWLRSMYLSESNIQAFEVSLGSISVKRPFGTFSWTGIWANYIGMLSPFALSMFWFGNSKNKRIFGIIAYSISITALIISVQRQEWIHIPIVFLLLAFIAYKRSIRLSKNVAKLITLLLIICILGFTFSELIMARLNQKLESSAVSRIPYAKLALKIIRKEPILGVGINNYTEVMDRYDRQWLIRKWDLTYAVHNEPLYIVAEIGIFGFFAYFLIWVSVAKNIAFCIRFAQGWVLLASAGISGALLATFVHRQFGPYWLDTPQTNVILWSLFGLSEALRALIVRKRPL